MQDSPQPLAVKQTLNWIKSVVVATNFCPFAAKPLRDKRIRFTVLSEKGDEAVSLALAAEFLHLDEHPETETSFLIFDKDFQDYYDYLDLVDAAEDFLEAEGYEGIYQVAGFHPEYCFAGESADDPANYTNRSPYPMLHLIREESLTQALDAYPFDPESIPENNIAFARQKGLEYMQKLRAACMNEE